MRRGDWRGREMGTCGARPADENPRQAGDPPAGGSTTSAGVRGASVAGRARADHIAQIASPAAALMWVWPGVPPSARWFSLAATRTCLLPSSLEIQ